MARANAAGGSDWPSSSAAIERQDQYVITGGARKSDRRIMPDRGSFLKVGGPLLESTPGSFLESVKVRSSAYEFDARGPCS
jgi:hypothetical protein